MDEKTWLRWYGRAIGNRNKMMEKETVGSTSEGPLNAIILRMTMRFAEGINSTRNMIKARSR